MGAKSPGRASLGGCAPGSAGPGGGGGPRVQLFEDSHQTGESYWNGTAVVMPPLANPALFGGTLNDFSMVLHACDGTVPPAAPAAWPAGGEPMFEQPRVGLSRTEPAWRDWPEVRECEALHLAGIAAAKTCIYMENQYFTSELMARSLGVRLAEPDGPDVLLVSTTRSPSYFDQNTMDPTRSRFIERLRAADRFGRFRIYSPVTALGRDIIVHAKVTIIDDVLVRIGSANMNNRSLGFDTECDLSIEAAGPMAESCRAAIGRLRADILAHWLGCPGGLIDDALANTGSICKAMESLIESGFDRLRPIEPRRLHAATALIARWHIGDPMSPADSFRPWRRRRVLEQECLTADV